MSSSQFSREKLIEQTKKSIQKLTRVQEQLQREKEDKEDEVESVERKKSSKSSHSKSSTVRSNIKVHDLPKRDVGVHYQPVKQKILTYEELLERASDPNRFKTPPKSDQDDSDDGDLKFDYNRKEIPKPKLKDDRIDFKKEKINSYDKGSYDKKKMIDDRKVLVPTKEKSSKVEKPSSKYLGENDKQFKKRRDDSRDRDHRDHKENKDRKEHREHKERREHKDYKEDSYKDHKQKRSREEDDDRGNARDELQSVLKNLFRYDKNKFRDYDDDVSDMEASLDEIRREESRSKRIARLEDAEEERREQERKKKKRKH